MSSEPLQEAYRLIRDGKKQEALRLLVPLVRADPLNADSWWLLANAVDNPEQKRRALKRVLSLRPNDERARQMLDGLPAPVTDSGFEVDAPRRSRSPLGIIIALIGLLTVVSCGICIAVFAISGSSIQSAFSEIILTVTYQVPDFATLASLATPGAPVIAVVAPTPGMPSDLQMRGSVESGQTVTGTVPTFQDDGWTFNGEANEHVIIELDATDPKLDPHLYLYDPNDQLIGDNDDIDGARNRNSRLDVTLTSAGTYTIRIGKFASGGAYQLTVTRQ